MYVWFAQYSSKKSKYYLFNMNLTWIAYIFYWLQIITYFQFYFSFWSYSEDR